LNNPMNRLWASWTKRKHPPQTPAEALNEPSPQPSGEPPRRTMSSPQPHVCAITDVGQVRDHNEDLFYVAPDGSWFVVADGMGGHEAGEVAAELAIQAIVEHLTAERIAAAATQDEMGSLLLAAVHAAHALVREENKKRQDGKEMGCTLVLGCLCGGLVTCHVGDSRCYILHEGVLRQITRDHSAVGALVEAGELTEEQARVHPDKNVVLQAIGTSGGILPDVNVAELIAGDRILLCSDGLWEELPHIDLQAIAASDGTVRQVATQLVDRANAAGGFDNITAILCEVLPSENPEFQDKHGLPSQEEGENKQ